MLLPRRRKGAAGIIAVAGAVLLGVTGALAAVNPGPTRVTEGWKLAEPAFTILDKDKSRQRKTKQWLKKNTSPLGTTRTSPGRRGKVNPGLPAVQ
jgi:hypothetical protein